MSKCCFNKYTKLQSPIASEHEQTASTSHTDDEYVLLTNIDPIRLSPPSMRNEHHTSTHEELVSILDNIKRMFILSGHSRLANIIALWRNNIGQ
jgi:hypothetical protein